MSWDDLYRDTPMRVRGWEQELFLLFSFHVQEAKRVLELGCGMALNWEPIRDYMFPHAQYHGIDASEQALKLARDKYPEIHALHCGDFSEGLPFESGFDVIFDRASVPHNTLAAMKQTLRLALEALKPGGIYIGVDWFSTAHSEYRRGERVNGENTFTGYTTGTFRNIGNVHFTDEREIEDIFDGFELQRVQERTQRIPLLIQKCPWIPDEFYGREYRLSVFDIVARKPL